MDTNAEETSTVDFTNDTNPPNGNWSMGNTDVLFYYYLWVVAAPIAFGLITLLGVVGNGLVIYVILSR